MSGKIVILAGAVLFALAYISGYDYISSIEAIVLDR